MAVVVGVGLQLHHRIGHAPHVTIGPVSSGVFPEFPVPECLRLQVLEPMLGEIHCPVVQRGSPECVVVARQRVGQIIDYVDDERTGRKRWERHIGMTLKLE